ncbi:hypothetical protein RIR_jg41445.t1 [Rhizophagus irregularis DAOM 181602=DAOM 197198]|nr:hypothetical protein RIR_jg41445.t1 [Rhizophagus irregularis DAOM 181602=DAOM 197198]
MRNENSKILPFMYSKKENSIPREWNVTTLVFSITIYGVCRSRTVFGSIVLRTKSKDNILQIRQIREIGE